MRLASSRCGRVGSTLATIVILMPLLISLGCSPQPQQKSPDNAKLLAKAIEGSGPFCLATEFQPLGFEESGLPTGLARELGRQAVLIAARDGLGLSTRDETLGEAFPDDVAARRGPYELTVRQYEGGKISLDLRSPDVLLDHMPIKLLQFEFQCQEDAVQLYTSQAEILGEAARGKLVEQLREAGFVGEPVPSDPEGAVPDGVESLLQKMDVVAQYAAVRQLHGAIAEKGESPARLGGLVRGYANLAALTRHHWSSSSAAFAARSLLYAERMIAASNESPLAYQCRAYARALAGMPVAALADLARAQDATAKDDSAATPPVWVAILEPFCNFQRDKLLELGVAPETRQLANLLAFDLVAFYGNERWNIAAGATALKACPDAYCIYSHLANHTPMQVQRQSVSGVAEAIGGRIPANVARIDGLPEPVHKLVSEELRPGASWLARLVTGETTSKALSPLPHEIDVGLRKQSEEAGDTSEPSWNVLATLIADEQFVAVADYLKVSMNAVEFSKKELVDRFMPLIEGHPYAPHVESYAVDNRRFAAESAQFAQKITVRDPHPGMQTMLYRYWNDVDANGQTYCNLYNHAIWAADRTFPAMVASVNAISDSWWKSQTVIDQFRPWVADFQAVSPLAPSALRLEILTTEKPGDELLAQWEERAAGDPVALSKVGKLYSDRGDYVAAIRCFDGSYSLSPAYDTATSLAEAYRAADQEDKWLPALESYLTEEDYSLGHALIHKAIANDYMRQGKWSAAKPHALEAAQTWSAWGLILASRVCEGLGQWDESEYWARQAVEGYPSYSGQEWYYWCVRNGRGDAAAARKTYDDFLQLDWVQSRKSDEDHPLLDKILTGRFQEALDDFPSRPKYAEDVYWQNHALLLAKRAGNDSLYTELTGKLVSQVNEQSSESDPNLCLLYALVNRLARQGSLEASDIAAADKLFEKYGPISRTNYGYFFGEQLAQHGDLENAQKYWRMSLAAGQFHKYNATLSGQRLAELNGTSRTEPFSEPEADAESGTEDGGENTTPAENSL